MASKVNTKFLLILFIVGGSLFAAMGGFYFYFTRSSAAHNLARAEEFAAAGDYRRAFSYYSRALGEDPANMQYLGKAEGVLLDIQPETAGEARELYAQYISVLRHAAVHHPTEADKHLRLLDELLSAARRASSWQYTELMEDAADDMWDRIPAGDSRRIHAKLYKGVAIVSPWMRDRRTNEEIAEGERALEEFLAEVPDSDIGWSSLVTARLAAWDRLRDASQITRATEAIQEVRETLARARAQVPDGPEVILAALMVSDRDHAVDPTTDDVEAVSMDATRMLQLVRDRDDPWLVSQAAIALERLYWLPDRESAIVVLDEYLAKHPESHEIRLLRARLQLARAQLDDAATTARFVVESELLGVGFLSQVQFELKKRAQALLIDVAVRRWDEGEAEEKDERVVQIEEAVAALAAMVTDLEADVLLKRARGQLAFARADYAKAAAVFNEILASDVDVDYPMKIFAAVSLEEIGEYGAAARIFEDALSDQPSNVAVLHHLARLRERLRQYEDADDLADIVLGLEPDHEGAILLKRRVAAALDPVGAMVADPVRRALEEAQIAYRAGTYDLARSTLLAVLASSPDHLSLLSALARVEVAAGQTDAARSYVKRGLELSPNNRVFRTMLAHLENPDRIEAVTEYIRQTYEDPTQRAMETLLAMRALRLDYAELARRNDTAGRSEDAATARQGEARSRAEEDAYRAKVVQVAPDDPRFIEYRFLRAVEAENWEEAERVVDAASSLNIDQAGGLLYRGRYLAGTKDPEAAARAFQKATERIPYSATAWRLLGITLQSLGNHSEALAAFEQSYENNPNDITTVLAYARLLGRLGNDTRMLTVLRKGRRLAPNDEDMREIWLTAEVKTGDAAVSLRERRRHYREDPTDLKNAAALATILGRADPVRELLIDEDGEDRFSFERWNRLPAGRREAILAQEQLEWYAEADEIVENLVAPERRDLGWHLLKAELLRDRGDVREGEAVLRGFAEQKTGGTQRLEALLVLGSYQGHTGHVDDAIALFESARAFQAPDKLQADIALAEIYFRNRRFAEAQQYLEAIVTTRSDRKLNLMLAESLQRLGQYGAALEHLDGVEADGGPDVTSLMLRASIVVSQAEEHWKAGRKTEAREGFRRSGETLDRAESLDPTNALTHVLRAKGWLQQFRQTGESILLDDALLALSEADEIELGLQETRQARVQVHEAKGNSRGAINELQRLVERFPGNDAARQRLVQMLINDGRPYPAIEIVERAVARDPGAAKWRVALGDLYYASEKMAERELAGIENQAGREARAKREEIIRLRIQIDQQYREALRAVPSAPLVLKRAEVLLEASPPAFNDAIDSIELYPEQLAVSPLLRAVYARALAESGRRPEAIEHLTASYVQFGEVINEGTMPPDAIQLWYANLLDVFRREGAAAATEFALALCDNQPDSYHLLALSALWMTRGQAGLGRVVDFVRQGIASCPADDDQHRMALYRMLGVALLLDEQFPESLDAYLHVLEIDPENPEVLNNVAFLYSESMKDPERGLPYAEDAVRLQPDNGSILDTIGWICFRLNRLDQAETQLRRSVQLEPMASNLVHLATVLVAKENITAAKRHLQRASEMNPNEETMAEIRRLADDIRTRSEDR